MYISKRNTPTSLSLPRPIPFSPSYTSAPAKECEFIDLIFIGKTEASSCRVCESVVWVCTCSPWPQTGVEKCMAGTSVGVRTLPALPTGRQGEPTQGSAGGSGPGAAHPACSGWPTPCALGRAPPRQGSEVGLRPPPQGSCARLPPASLRLTRFPRVKSSA